MIRLIPVVRPGLILLLLTSLAIANADDAEEGFQVLYTEGNPLTQGWKMVGPGAVVEESPGVLKTEGGMGMLWYAERPFQDFVLRLDYQISRPNDNSGVFVRFPNPPKDPWEAVNEGYEIQICDGASPEHRTGAIYSFKGPEKKPPTRPVGEWNSYEIAVEGQTYTIKLNGETINNFEGSRGEQGYIGLQNHDDRSIVRFRDIRIKSLENP